MATRTNRKRQAQMKTVWACRFCNEPFSKPKRNTQGFCDDDCRELWEENGGRAIDATQARLGRCTTCKRQSYRLTCSTCRGRIKASLRATRERRGGKPNKARKGKRQQWTQGELF